MNNFVDLNVESVWTDRLAQELRPFGITDYFYTCFYLHEDRVSTCTPKVADRISYLKQLPRHMKTMHYCSSFTRSKLTLLERFLSYEANTFDGYHRQPSWQLEMIVNPSNTFSSEHAPNHRSVAICESRSVTHPGFIGFYLLHSDLTMPQFAFQISTQGKRIETLLQNYHQRFTLEKNEFNPWVNTGAVPVKAQRILQMLSEGKDTQQIGEELYLSRRGIDYHLNTLKVSLNTSNRNHLLAKACFLEIVNHTNVIKKFEC